MIRDREQRTIARAYSLVPLIHTGQVKSPRVRIQSQPRTTLGTSFSSPAISYPLQTEVQEPSRLDRCFSAFEVALEKGTRRS